MEDLLVHGQPHMARPPAIAPGRKQCAVRRGLCTHPAARCAFCPDFTADTAGVRGVAQGTVQQNHGEARYKMPVLSGHGRLSSRPLHKGYPLTQPGTSKTLQQLWNDRGTEPVLHAALFVEGTLSMMMRICAPTEDSVSHWRMGSSFCLAYSVVPLSAVRHR